MSVLGGCWPAIRAVFTAVPLDAPAPPPVPPEPDDGFGTRLTAHLRRRPGRLVAACVATVLGPAVVAQAGSIHSQPALETPAVLPSPPLPAPVPGDGMTWLSVARQAAATCPGLPSTVLIAIGHVESRLGLHLGPSSAGAVGPMQFLPSTWAAYAADGDGDGRTDVMNPADAMHGAARLLCANGGADPDHLRSALWNYNRSDDYVRHVMALARLLPAGT